MEDDNEMEDGGLLIDEDFNNDENDEVEVIKLEEARSSDEEHIFPFTFNKVNNDQGKLIEGRIYVIDVEPPENYQLAVRLGLLTHITSEDELNFTLVDNQKIHPRSNVGQLLKTGTDLLYDYRRKLFIEHKHTLSLSQVSCVVENLRYQDQISTRIFEEDYNDFIFDFDDMSE